MTGTDKPKTLSESASQLHEEVESDKLSRTETSPLSFPVINSPKGNTGTGTVPQNLKLMTNFAGTARRPIYREIVFFFQIENIEYRPNVEYFFPDTWPKLSLL